MLMRNVARAAAAAALAVVFAAQVLADVLVLRDGRRFDGRLRTVREGTIDFEHRGGSDDGRVRRYDRDDVLRVEFGEVDSRRPGMLPRGRSGMRERVVAVDSRMPWTDTGLDVRAGQEMLFAATGEVRWGPGRRDGASGERDSKRNDKRPMPERPAAALIGRIGPDGDPFFIGGSAQPMRVRATGRLYLGLNDDYLQDNSGSLRVRVLY